MAFTHARYASLLITFVFIAHSYTHGYPTSPVGVSTMNSIEEFFLQPTRNASTFQQRFLTKPPISACFGTGPRHAYDGSPRASITGHQNPIDPLSERTELL